MFSITKDLRSLLEIATFDVHNHSRAASDSRIIIKVPLLIGTSVGFVCDDGSTVDTPGDVQDKAKIGETC
jgi:hypothetical protein